MTDLLACFLRTKWTTHSFCMRGESERGRVLFISFNDCVKRESILKTSIRFVWAFHHLAYIELYLNYDSFIKSFNNIYIMLNKERVIYHFLI
jgi:hypothetical protein